jgi:hypothetical protein
VQFLGTATLWFGIDSGKASVRSPIKDTLHYLLKQYGTDKNSNIDEVS